VRYHENIGHPSLEVLLDQKKDKLKENLLKEKLIHSKHEDNVAMLPRKKLLVMQRNG
jgi:hypothetical protein